MTRAGLRRPFPDYDNRLRRRMRGVLRIYGTAGRSLVTRSPIVPAYWWDGTPNFGDALTPWLLPRYGLTPVHTPADRARLAGVGSILEQLAPSFSGAVWGSGLLYGDPVELPHATFVAVRGALTRDALGLDRSVVLGDPGLLVGRHVRRRRTRWRVGLVPHHAHLGNADVRRLATAPGVTLIDVTYGPTHVMRRIAACEAIVSSSLHGLVTADALGIPAAWAVSEPALWGGEFKFRDYESVLRPVDDRRVALSASTTHRELLRSVATPDAGRRDAVVAALEGTIDRVPSRPGVAALAWLYR